MLLEDFLKKVVAETLAEPSLRDMLRKKMNLGDYEAPTREAFSLETLRSKPTLKEARAYIRESLGEELGRGHARGAWAIDDKTIVKVVLGTKLYENENEVKHAACLGEEYAVKVFEFHPEFWWLIEERLNPIQESDFVKRFNALTGVTMNSSDEIQDAFAFLDHMKDEWSVANDPAFPASKLLHQKLLGNKWFAGLVDKIELCNVHPKDFHCKNWGLRPSTGQLVLIDVGF